ncbi:MAG TPA: alpha/beta hydrolase [Mycobacterium sp.]|nr:alpha/beta hydrolase [Mycobacterium sp.]
MTLDPEIAELLPALNADFPPVEKMTGPQVRAAIRSRMPVTATPEPVGAVFEHRLPGPAGEVPARIYRPATTSGAPPPVIVFAHGGGFVFCDLDTHDGLCRAMANGVSAVVVSVDYRLAPEAQWPAAAEDLYAATQWTAQHATELGGDPACLLVAGDSAGGNLAAVTALLARDRGGPAISGMALLYPVIAADFGTETYRRYGVGFYNTRAAMEWYWDQYLPALADRAHPYASPLRAELAGLPPAVVVTAGHDPLGSEGEQFANALAAAGVPTVHRCYAGAIHGFMTMAGLSLAARARRQAWADIARLVSTARSAGGHPPSVAQP